MKTKTTKYCQLLSRCLSYSNTRLLQSAAACISLRGRSSPIITDGGRKPCLFLFGELPPCWESFVCWRKLMQKTINPCSKLEVIAATTGEEISLGVCISIGTDSGKILWLLRHVCSAGESVQPPAAPIAVRAQLSSADGCQTKQQHADGKACVHFHLRLLYVWDLIKLD